MNDRQGPVVKLASYNIRKAIGTDRVRNPARILSVLQEIDADIVLLQEADRRFGRRERALPAFLIEQQSNYHQVPLDVQRDSMGWHGNAILVRDTITVEHQDIIHIPYLEPRGVVMATLKIGKQRLSVFGMHLDLSGLWRARQARAIAQLANSYRQDQPILLAGDLNEWRSNSGCYREFSRHFSILDCGRSFHSQTPVAKLDRVMHCEKLRPVEWGVHRTPLAAKASDHLPVWASLELLSDKR